MGWSNFSSPLVPTKFLKILKGERRSPLISFIQCLRRGATHNKKRATASKLSPFFCRLGWVSVSYLSRLEKGRLATSPKATKRGAGEGRRLHDMRGNKLSTKLCPLLYRDCYELTKLLDSPGTLAKLIKSISSLQSNQ